MLKLWGSFLWSEDQCLIWAENVVTLLPQHQARAWSVPGSQLQSHWQQPILARGYTQCLFLDIMCRDLHATEKRDMRSLLDSICSWMQFFSALFTVRVSLSYWACRLRIPAIKNCFFLAAIMISSQQTVLWLTLGTIYDCAICRSSQCFRCNFSWCRCTSIQKGKYLWRKENKKHLLLARLAII